MDKKDKRQKIIVKLVCVLLSFGLWIYVTNIQSSIRTYTLKDVPVRLLNTKSLNQFNLAISPGQDFTVDLKIEGDSKYIYSVTKGEFSLVADMGEYALKTGVNNIPVQVVNSPSQVNIQNDSNLIVSVKLEKLVSKEFNTVSNVNVTYANGVYKKEESFTSEKVQVSGPESSVNKVERVALVGQLNNVNGNITKQFPLEALDSNGEVVQGVILSKSTGSISVAVNNGKSINIEPTVTGNLPSGYTLSKVTSDITAVQVVGNQNIISNLKSLKTEPIDLSGITETTEKKVKIILPDGVKLATGDGYTNVKIEVSKDEGKKDESEKNITKNFDVNIKYTGLNDKLDISNNTPTINITVSGKQGDVDSLTSGDFTGTFDLSSYSKAGTFEKEPNVKLNKNVNVTIQNIGKVKFTLKEKDTTTSTDNNQNNEDNSKKTT